MALINPDTDPTDPAGLFYQPTDPAMEAVARAVEADYPEYEVSVHFNAIYVAVLRGSGCGAHVEASDEDELRAKLNADRSLRRWAAADGGES
jgi:hypothetical protein